MKLSLRVIVVAAAVVAVAAFSATPSYAWTATSISSFKSISGTGQCGDGKITVSSGGVFAFYKPSGANRCEAKGANGINPAKGKTYTINWKFKLNNIANNNAIFQWKSYGSPMLQNYPLVLKVISKQLVFQYTPPSASSVQPSKTTIAANTTYTVKLTILVNSGTTSGRVTYALNGSTKLSNYACRTFDGTSVEPKWGVYGGSSTSITDTVSGLTMN